jgi:hypothetical protein
MNIEPCSKYVHGEGLNQGYRFNAYNGMLHLHPEVVSRRNSGVGIHRSNVSSPRRSQQHGTSKEFPEASTETPPWVKALQKRRDGSDCGNGKLLLEKKSENVFFPWTEEPNKGITNNDLHKTKIEPPGPFIGDAFSSLSNNVGTTSKPLKEKKKVSGDKKKGKSKKVKDKSEVSEKKSITNNKSLKKPANASTNCESGIAQIEPFVVNWCRSNHHTPNKKTLLASPPLPSHEVEATSTTSATSRSGECFDTQNISKMPTSSREVNFFSEFGFNWTNSDNTVSKEPSTLRKSNEVISEREINRSTRRNSSSDGKIKKCRNTAKGTVTILDSCKDDACKITWTREPLTSPLKAKPRLSMVITSPTKKMIRDSKRDVKKDWEQYRKDAGTKIVKLQLEDDNIGFDNSFCDALEVDKFNKPTTTNTEPLDFSDFDEQDFSTGDFSVPSLLTNKHVLPLHNTPNKDIPFGTSFYRPSADKMRSSPFSSKWNANL